MAQKKQKRIVIKRFGNYINTVLVCLVDKWISDNVAVRTGEVEISDDGVEIPIYHGVSGMTVKDRLAAAKGAGYTFSVAK